MWGVRCGLFYLHLTVLVSGNYIMGVVFEHLVFSDAFKESVMKKKLLASVMVIAAVACLTACEETSTGVQSGETPNYSDDAALSSSSKNPESSAEDGASDDSSGSSSSSESGSNDVEAKCGTATYDPETQVCDEDERVLPKCGEVGYDPVTQYCKDGTTPTDFPTCGTEEYNPNEQLCDTRDEKIYKITTIDQKVWMAENLNYETDEESYCAGADESEMEAYCTTYGRLYTWNAVASKSNPLCPDGWHVPTNGELANFDGIPGSQLAATSGWKNDANGTNDFGFSALPAGNRSSGGDFKGAGSYAQFWSATDEGDDAYFMHVQTTDAVSLEKAYKYLAISVRCVQD